MKALLVADTDITESTIAKYLKPYGFDLIRYRSAVKAIDNIDEIAPDAVFISAIDFPRHWKAISQFIRADTAKEKTLVILLVNERFTPEDADKAIHIGVQAIVKEALNDPDDGKRLGDVFSRYRRLGAGESPTELEDPGERAVFMFTNPKTDAIITGKVETISRTEIMFRPDAPAQASGLPPGTTLELCSLKIDDKVLSPKCEIKRNENLIILEFTGMSEADRRLIDRFIAGSR